ncbi:MAG: hypothetical protein OXH59_01565 [Rhodospirillaceae bacterium]|nr:hypothetical protein [Rhodospirillaceae bacterium]
MLTATRACAVALFAAVLAVGLPGAALAQESLTPAQKAEKLFYGYDRYGAKFSYGPVSEENGVLTIRNLKYEVAMPWQDPKNPDAPKKTETLSFTAETIVARRYDYRNPELPHFADLTFSGIRPGGSVLDLMGWSRSLAVFGGETLVIDLSQVYELDPAAGSVTLDSGTATIRGLLRVEMAGRFDGVEFARLRDPKLLEKLGPGSVGSTQPDAVGTMFLDLFAATRVHRMTYAMTDLGGLSRIFAFVAEEHSKKNPDAPKITAKAMRQGFAGSLAGMTARFSGVFAPAMLRAAARWMQAPGTLTIALRPGRPLPVASIIGYFGALSAQAKQAKGQKLDLDPLQKFLGLSLTYTPAAR